MAESFPLDQSMLDKWRDRLRDIDFWLKGYLNSDAYYSLRKKLVACKHMQWNVGVGPMASFTEAISSIIRDEKMRLDGSFDLIIEVDMKQASRSMTRLNINDRLAIKVAEQLGLLTRSQEYTRLKEEDDELRYYTYGMMDSADSLQNLSRSMVPHILQKLLGKRYMLVVQNLDKAINTDVLTVEVGLPPPAWEGSFWLMSTTSRVVYESSDNKCAVQSFTGDDILTLSVYSLHKAAKRISNVIGDKDEQHWHLVSLGCFHYAVTLLNPFMGEFDKSSLNSPVLPIPSPSFCRRHCIFRESYAGESTPATLPYNFKSHGVFAPYLQKADEVEPLVAYLYRFHTFEEVHRLDPTDSGRGVRQFKTALLERLERDYSHTLEQRFKCSDYLREMESLYKTYLAGRDYYANKWQKVLENKKARDINGYYGEFSKWDDKCKVLDIVLASTRRRVWLGSPEEKDIASDKHELIWQWASHCILLDTKGTVREGIGEVTDSYHGKYNDDDDDIYRIGNVILETFQEYSLLQLPFQSAAFKAGDAMKTAAHFLAYHSLITEKLATDELWHYHHQSNLEHMRWISHVDDRGWQISREWLSHGPRGPTTLSIRRCSPSFFEKLDQLLPKLLYLHVLDLSYTQIESLPPSVCSLQKLQSLFLKGCHNLANPFSFPSTNTTSPGKNSNNMISLLYLDLSYSNVETFDSDFFHNMPSLQELFLVCCFRLVELPPSIAALSSLTTLKLSNTLIESFNCEIFNPMIKLRSFEQINNFEEWGCRTEEELKLEGHPTLRSFSLVAAPYIRRLSFNGCRKLESVDTLKGLCALEELDLSATGIKELQAVILNLPRLGRLLLIGVPALRRFPWHDLKQLPDMFSLDQSLEGNGVHSSPQVAQVVSTNNSRLFYSFNRSTVNLVRSGQIFKSFYIQIKSFKARFMNMNDEANMVTSNRLQILVSTYNDVNNQYLTGGVSMVSMDDMLHFRVTERHAEISAVDQYPAGLTHVLEVTKSVCMTDDTHVTCLSDHLSNFNDLEECKLMRCHCMVHVFEVVTYLGNNLKNAWVSYLKSLTHFYRPSGSGATFRALKHVRLEHCPRLEGFMPSDCELPSLVTLDILFCYNLKAIFYNNGHHSSPRHYQLPCLQKIRLQELPLLEHLYDGENVLTVPQWEEFIVRGCWSLRRLPRLHQQPNNTVKVRGEQAWWAKLRWDDDQGDDTPHHRSVYEPSLPLAFTFVRERFVIKSYLR